MRPRVVGVFTAIVLLLTVALPALGADSDRDGLRDSFEKKWGVTSPYKRDSDGDGVIDSAEDNDHDRLSNLGEQRFGTNPGKKDTDRDGTKDGNEDKDRNGRTNAREQDKRRLPKGVKPTVGKAAGDWAPHRGDCMTFAGRSTLKHCTFGDAGSDTTVVMMGDSHALMWLAPAITVATQKGWRLRTLFKAGCTPVLGTINTGQWKTDKGVTCRAWRKAAYEWLDSHPADLIILANADSYQLVDSKGRIISSANKPKVWRAGLRRTLDGIADPAKVLIWGDVPNTTGNPIHCLKKSPWNMSACVTRKEPRAERIIENALRAVAAEKGAQFGSLYSKICSYDPCPLVQGKIMMWRDGSHVTVTFARKLRPSVRDLMVNGLAAAAPAGKRGE